MLLMLLSTATAFAQSVDECTESYSLCQGACQQTADQCTSKSDDPSDCADQYEPCEKACRTAQDQCNSGFPQN